MSVRSALAWSYGTQAFTFVVLFGSSVIVARLLSPHEVGVFAIAMATAGILAIFTSFSIQSYIVREGQLSDHMIRSVYTVNLLMNLLLSALTAGVGCLQMFVFNRADVGAVLLLSALGPLLGVFEFVPSTLYQREMNFGVLSRVGIVKTIINSATVVSCAYSGFGSLSPAVGPLVAGLFSTLFYVVARRKDIILRPTRHGLRPIIVFGFQIMSINGVAQMAQRSTDIILGTMLGLTALGMYSRASNLSNMIFSNVYGLATSVIFVKLSNDLRDNGSIHETFIKSMRLITCIMWPLIIGVAVVARPAIHILYGDKWLGAALPLSLLLIAQFIALGFGMNWELFVLRRETARQSRIEVARAVTTLIFVTIGCFFSIAAAAAARIAEATVGYLLYRPHIDRLAGTDRGELEQVLRESFVYTVIAVSPSVLLMVRNGWSESTAPTELFAAVMIGIVAWLFALIYRKHVVIEELLLILSRVPLMNLKRR